jgi:hypothetical protein
VGCDGGGAQAELGREDVNPSVRLAERRANTFHRQLYYETEDEWFGKPEVFDRPDVLEVRSSPFWYPLPYRHSLQERHRIDVDCRRTDRSQPLFAAASAAQKEAAAHSGGDPEKQRHRRLASIAPNANEIGAQSPSNEHIDRLASVLLTYNFYEKKLGTLIRLPTVDRADASQDTSRACQTCARQYML